MRIVVTGYIVSLSNSLLCLTQHTVFAQTDAQVCNLSFRES